MAFEEWLALGGNEIINNARTVGYAKTADCPMAWFKGRVCPTLAAATLAAELYDSSDLARSPWYDPVLPEISSRFYGAYGLSISGIEDSTRSASVTEGLSDGGVIGRVRKGPREIRVVAILAGEGRDALEYGMAWLNAALDPNACGQHGDACGTADLAYFSDCPPQREQVPIYTDWALATTNLVTNPSFESTSGLTVVRTNLANNPGFEQDIAGWVVSGATATAESDWAYTGAKSAKVTATANNPASGDVRLAGGSATTFPAGIVAGKTYTVSAWVNTPLAHTAFQQDANVSRQRRILFFYSVNGTGFVQQFGPQGENIAGVQRLSYTFTVPADATGVQIGVGSAGSANAADANFVSYVDGVLIEESGRLGGYFDGTTEDADFDYGWTGTENGSTSTQSAPGVAGVPNMSADQGIRWRTSSAFHGLYAERHMLRTTSAIALAVTNFSPTTGTTYTLTGRVRPMHRDTSFIPRIRDAKGPRFTAPMGVWTEFRVTIPAGAGAVNQTGLLLDAQSGHEYDDVVDIDSVVLAEQEYDGPYFDGDDADTDLETYEWTGEPHASTTTLSTRQITEYAPVGLDEYVGEVNKVRRFLHDVAAVSGPLVQAEFQSGKHWAYQVEYTLVAANPYVYGVMRVLDLPPRLPTVVADVPYNIITHPSAELASGEVVVQTNYVRNPSVEVDAANFTTGTNVVTPSATGARSTELAANGGASFKVSTTTTNSGTDASNGVIYANQAVPLPAYVAGQRVSFNAWVASVVTSGTAVFEQVRFKAEWRDAADALIGTVVVGTGPAAGAAISMKSVPRPANAASVRLVMLADLESWSVGAQIAVYTDALAVTIP